MDVQIVQNRSYAHGNNAGINGHRYKSMVGRWARAADNGIHYARICTQKKREDDCALQIRCRCAFLCALRQRRSSPEAHERWWMPRHLDQFLHCRDCQAADKGAKDERRAGWRICVWQPAAPCHLGRKRSSTALYLTTAAGERPGLSLGLHIIGLTILPHSGATRELWFMDAGTRKSTARKKEFCFNFGHTFKTIIWFWKFATFLLTPEIWNISSPSKIFYSSLMKIGLIFLLKIARQTSLSTKRLKLRILPQNNTNN